MSSDQTQSNLGFLWDMALWVWNTLLKPVYDFMAAWLGPYIHQTLDSLQNHTPLPMMDPSGIVPEVD